MALVSAGFELTVTLVDAAGDPTTRTYDLIATTAANAATATTTILAALNAVTSAQVSGYRLAEVFVEDALSLPAGSDVDITALMTAFIADEGQKKGNYSIPSPIDDIFVAPLGVGRNIVNTSEQIVLNYHALFNGAGRVANFSDGEEAGGLIKGVRVVGRKRQRTE